MALYGMITTKGSQEYTDHALRSFFLYTPLSSKDHFVLIDNNQSGYAAPTDLASRIELVRNDQPKGFAANGNFLIGLALSRKEHLFFLNNDVIFSKNWLTPLLADEVSILSPLSNREVQYASAISVVSTAKVAGQLFLKMPPMDLQDYLGQEMLFQGIAEAHQRGNAGYLMQICLPFFAIKIPYPVMSTIGRFDESYGLGGGEDFDYAMRANLAGFSVGFALGSYLLHFGGRSTWNSEEEKIRQQERQNKYRQRFEEKWGFPLLDLIMNENPKVLDAISATHARPQDLKPREIIAALMTNKNFPLAL